MSQLAKASSGLFLTLVLTACQPAPEPSSNGEIARPVLTKTLALENATEDRFAGEVVARYETSLGFRTFGRVISRSVELGDAVQKGQQIAQLDSTQQELAVRSAEANLSSAQAQLNNLLAVEQRQQALLAQNNVAPSAFESAQLARRAADSALAQAKTQLEKAREQLGYTTLLTESAGVVTNVAVEPGQTIAGGETIVTLVQPEVREALISIIEGDAQNVRAGDQFTISKQLDPSTFVSGTVREVAPQADPTTRTVSVRIAMDDAAGTFRLGSTIVASRAASELKDLIVPETAVFRDDAGTHVWVLAASGDSVAKRTITAERRVSGDYLVQEGLAAGETIVIAGANSLVDGQKVAGNKGQVQ